MEERVSVVVKMGQFLLNATLADGVTTDAGGNDDGTRNVLQMEMLAPNGGAHIVTAENIPCNHFAITAQSYTNTAR